MTEKQQEVKTFVRFGVLHRLMHLVAMIGFTGLALTGFSLKFSSHGWAQAVAWLLGGPTALGGWHRFFAVFTYMGVVVYVSWFLYDRLILKKRVMGPESIFPRRQDVKDLVQHVRWMLGGKSMPRFHRFSYAEKADFWAIFVGMNTMGLTGLVLWFPEWWAEFLPGYFINLAFVLHFWEAVLAVAVKFVVHIVNAHFRPDVWPADMAIFNGRTTEERMKHEHPEEWERLTQAAESDPARAET